MPDRLKLSVDAHQGPDRWREIEAIELTLQFSGTVDIDGAPQRVTVSYRHRVARIIEGTAK
jgi:hypothetical protein